TNPPPRTLEIYKQHIETAKGKSVIDFNHWAMPTILEEICKIVIYLTDIRYREAVYGVVGKWLKGVHPVSTGLVVEALARPEWLVEIDATAVISGEAGG
ncbi:MAG: Rid family hydrolase, partial [Solirubrobacteraceae bacterium]